MGRFTTVKTLTRFLKTVLEEKSSNVQISDDEQFIQIIAPESAIGQIENWLDDRTIDYSSYEFAFDDDTSDEPGEDRKSFGEKFLNWEPAVVSVQAWKDGRLCVHEVG